MNKTEELEHSLANSITLNDLVMMRNIINVASKRGAFSAEEFSDIGAIYNKVDSFLKLHLKNMDDDDNSEKQSEKECKKSSNKSKMEDKIEI
tara:strand:+ start:230 stop:505 length:276 start_codon:yes stop_codon:yes gene_type:complete